MLNFPRWQIWAISLAVLAGVLLAIPSMIPPSVTGNLPGWAKRVNLGLDLAGGSHLMLEADVAGLQRQQLELMEESVRQEMRRNTIQIAEVSSANGQVSFVVSNPAQVADALRRVQVLGQGSLTSGQRTWNAAANGNRIVVTPTDAGRSAALETAMSGVRDVIDRRINQLGTLEPTIIRQGAERIVVQAPGVQDPEALKSLIGRTARLEFKMVAQGVTPEQIASGRAPAGVQILPSQEGGQVAVERRAMVRGDQITDASQAFDQTTNEPVVAISFDAQGGAAFARATQAGVGRQFAMILDGVVLSAPTIIQPILGGRAQVTGSFTVASANELAISLKSGSLPVELRVVEERTISPELGADSIRLGVVATIIGSALVILFMLATYGRFGLFAIAALVMNVLIILGVMALIGATLTLPGIAGFVLTIGAAVDANIIINERIREELRKGRTILDAIDNGWKEASTAILDANVTNAIAGALMFMMGSGPIKGFAVVLMIGIITSAFTAIVVARMMVAIWVRRTRPKTLVL